MPNTSARKILESALLGKRIRFKKRVDGTMLTGETGPILNLQSEAGYIRYAWENAHQGYDHISIYIGEQFEILEEEEPKDA